MDTSMTKYRLISVLILVLGVAAFLAFKGYSRVNATSTALLNNFIMIPCVIADAFLCITVFLSRNPKKVLIVQAIVVFVIFYWFIDYVFIKN